MAETSTLARPYAQAIFNLAHANNTLKAWSDTLALLKEVTANESMVELINNPSVSDEQVILLITEICKDGLDEQGQNFLKVTAENGRLEVLPFIADSFEAMRAEEEGSIEAQVISAYAVNATQKKSIAAALKKKLGREVTITTQTDKTLLGGVIIRAGDMVIDGSVKSQLEKITHSLLS
ncbi:MAG: F0F1 ATP synthase subunit delta [gamma proteobacterium symbiont of Bathyaustriella thionipta]|nr:F0F1 ATP synthase subunit delta [gamma proteobacterium symbiont of Bathyaustriella thionipta]MCU7949195.1 F0F1 ATP synthase subunit delta [gamma proteobacterium symbiont of Bathyaustriella thionipta]MCU7952071.1 F0F1 ATP synthase subunit delta [gamma proteobacterium symbiont of Bathyaustriella thionipta]MCU7955763.1 F0F1 ATP synthase subunit delta [gamma proteobacterium symbiont of Bathyaustriella thionipta]MCU7965665.1 F0F1 ATP synthase subunit delta [gamma proteobacterium symbiont of Bathy